MKKAPGLVSLTVASVLAFAGVPETHGQTSDPDGSSLRTAGMDTQSEIFDTVKTTLNGAFSYIARVHKALDNVVQTPAQMDARVVRDLVNGKYGEPGPRDYSYAIQKMESDLADLVKGIESGSSTDLAALQSKGLLEEGKKQLENVRCVLSPGLCLGAPGESLTSPLLDKQFGKDGIPLPVDKSWDVPSSSPRVVKPVAAPGVLI